MGRTKTFHIVAWLTLFSIALTMSTGIASKAIEELASNGATNYLSLDRKLESFGHITTTTVGAVNTLGTDARRDDGIATYSSRGPTRSSSAAALLLQANTKLTPNMIKIITQYQPVYSLGNLLGDGVVLGDEVVPGEAFSSDVGNA